MTWAQIPRPLRSEVAAVLCIGAVPDVYWSILSLIHGQSADELQHQLNVLARAVWVSVPVLWILRHCGADRAALGLTPLRGRDLWVGGLAFATTCAIAFLPLTLPTMLHLQMEPRPRVAPSPALHLVAPLSSIANGFAEELVVRAYLIGRLRPVLGPGRALLLSTAVFAAYHAYLGPWAMLTVATMGFVLGSWFLLTPRLWPVAVAHALLDYVAILQL